MAAGRAFLRANCGYEAFPARLARLEPPARRRPRVHAISVVVPVHRHWELVPGLLAALAAQSRRRFEMILVNDDAAPAPCPARHSRVLDAPGPGSYAARNAGAAAARGRLLAFTDADCRPEPGWLAALAAAAAAARRARCSPARSGCWRPATPTACARYELVRGIPQARYVARGYAATANLAVPADVFRALGGFENRRSGGDAEFCRRAGRAGHPLRLVPGARRRPSLPHRLGRSWR